MGFWRKFSAMVWFLSGIFELLFFPSALTLSFFFVATAYWLMVMLSHEWSGGTAKALFTILTILLWALSLFFLL